MNKKTPVNAINLRWRWAQMYARTRRSPASDWAASIVGDRGMLSGGLESAGDVVIEYGSFR